MPHCTLKLEHISLGPEDQNTDSDENEDDETVVIIDDEEGKN